MDTHPATLAEAQKILKQTFGFDNFLPGQAAVIANVLRGNDSLAVMPTGGGKSLCYQLPALMFPGLSVVVSPLISLMQDQVDQLRAWDVPAATLNSSLPRAAYEQVTTAVRQGQIKLLYMAPETLLHPGTLLMLDELDIDLLAIDEAHCISAWGHDFRPEYRQLHELRQRWPTAVCLALTATATPRVRQDIRHSLGLDQANEFIASFDRPNLYLEVQTRHNGLAQIDTFLTERRDQSGIIYCTTRRRVDELAIQLQQHGWDALPYHAGLDSAQRERTQRQFAHDDVAIIVATVAFGMGIDKSNVRFVIHYNLPKDIESYYQEIGRAGRDGLPATCLLLYSQGDLGTLHFLQRRGDENKPQERAAAFRLQAMQRYATAYQCRRQILLDYFDETYPAESCDTCDNCQQEEQALEDLTVPAQKFLSCVYRTGEIFGINHIIAVLRGSQSKQVLERGHDQLSTYNIGREYSTKQWRELAQQFIQAGLLLQDAQYGSLKISAAGGAVLKGEQSFQGRGVQTLRRAARTRAARTRSGLAATLPYDATLFEQLRAKRRELAEAENQPAFTIMHDRSLMEMATYWPTTAVELQDIYGIGQAKVAKYGDDFLPLIRAFREAHPDLSPVAKAAVEAGSGSLAAPRIVATNSDAEAIWNIVTQYDRRTDGVGMAFEQGYSIADITAVLGVKKGTVVRHLEKHVLEEQRAIDPARLKAESGLPEEEWARVSAAFAELGGERLKPVYEALGETVPYEVLRLVRLTS